MFVVTRLLSASRPVLQLLDDSDPVRSRIRAEETSVPKTEMYEELPMMTS